MLSAVNESESVAAITVTTRTSEGHRLRVAGGLPALQLPLMPLFLRGNTTPAIQHCFRRLQRSQLPYRCADVAKESGRKGSNVYEVNQWLWSFGRGKPRLGGLLVSETEVQLMAVMLEGAKRGHATLTKRRDKFPDNAPKVAAAE